MTGAGVAMVQDRPARDDGPSGHLRAAGFIASTASDVCSACWFRFIVVVLKRTGADTWGDDGRTCGSTST